MGNRRLFLQKSGDDSAPFIITVQTDASVSSPDDQFTIPTFSSLTYDYDVTTSDGQTILGNTGDLTITFPSIGTYDIEISGDFPRLYLNNTGDKNKLIDVKQWGSQVWNSFQNNFRGCVNLTSLSATDAPDLSEVVNMQYTFLSCTNLVSVNNMEDWDVSNVTNMRGLIYACKIDGNGMENWDVSNVNNFREFAQSNNWFDISMANWNVEANNDFTMMSNSAGLSTANYDATLISWSQQNVSPNEIANFGGSKYTLYGAAEAARDILINTYGWIFTDGGGVSPFIMEVTTDNNGVSNNDQFTLPAIGTYTVDWGDGIIEDLSGVQTHTYSVAGTYDVSVSEGLTQIDFFTTDDDRDKLINIKQWGTVAWTSMQRAFRNCINLTQVTATDMPNFIDNINCRAMFESCSNLANINNIENWDMSTIKNFRQTFNANTNFDQSLANWEIAQVTDFLLMFSNVHLSTVNYDAMLISWASQIPLESKDISFGALSQYTLGFAANQVVNGTFDTDTDWGKEALWTIAGGTANGNGANASGEELTQTGVCTIGTTYVFQYDIVNYVSGSVAMWNEAVFDYQSGDGTYYHIFEAEDVQIRFRGSTFFGSIDNVLVRELTPELAREFLTDSRLWTIFDGGGI